MLGVGVIFHAPKHRGGGPEVIAKSLGLRGSNHRNSQQPGGVKGVEKKPGSFLNFPHFIFC